MSKFFWTISEPARIRAGFGLSPIRNKREEKALIDFCKSELENTPTSTINLNPAKFDVFAETIKLQGTSEFYHYVTAHADMYWS